jgi:hypothetical protein
MRDMNRMNLSIPAPLVPHVDALASGDWWLLAGLLASLGAFSSLAAAKRRLERKQAGPRR